MKRSFILLLVLFSLSRSVSAQTDTTSKYFTVLYKTGKNWDAAKATNEQAFFKEHSQFLSDLRKKNIIKAGARYSDIGMLIIKAKDLVTAENLINSDIAIVNGLFSISVFEASFFYKGCID
ncbi:MAG: hypothetical protein WDN26_05660 [Chitinophagaceae bacterium]